jgi:hypothetical protein
MLKQIRDVVGRFHNLLEVVEEQQHVPCLQLLL